MKALVIALPIVLAPTITLAHDVLDDGEPVPPWIKAACCSKADAHHLTQAQVHAVPGGWKIDGYPDVIPSEQALPSPDGSYWAFYKDLGNGQFTRIYCFFVGFSGT
jgi:hypothetical protein